MINSETFFLFSKAYNHHSFGKPIQISIGYVIHQIISKLYPVALFSDMTLRTLQAVNETFIKHIVRHTIQKTRPTENYSLQASQ